MPVLPLLDPFALIATDMFERIVKIGHKGDHASGRGGTALRALEWSEVTARLEAARDLRRLMRTDSSLSLATHASSFGDAAANCFRALEKNERAVNSDGLEGRKASERNIPEHQRDAATSDAREY
jgi:hypothetical protein